MDREALTGRAVGAARAVAERHGLAPTGHQVLSDRGNAVVRIEPYPLVARVTTLGAPLRLDQGDWQRREVAVAAEAAAGGAPVVAPSALLDPGPHHEDGLWLSFWEAVDVRRLLPGAEQVGRSLAALHDALGGVRFPAGPVLGPVHELTRGGLALLGREAALPPAVLDRLRAEHDALRPALADVGGPPVGLHGDAHPGNLLRAGTGWVWTDLEETCRGPALWDLAVATGGSDRVDTAATTLGAYAEATARVLRSRSGWPRTGGCD